MNAKKFLKLYRQMCDGCDSCYDCPLYDEPCDITSKHFNVESVYRKVVNWSETQQKSYKQTFKERLDNIYPGNTVNIEDLCNLLCLKEVFGEEHKPKVCHGGACLDCWNRTCNYK